MKNRFFAIAFAAVFAAIIMLSVNTVSAGHHDRDRHHDKHRSHHSTKNALVAGLAYGIGYAIVTGGKDNGYHRSYSPYRSHRPPYNYYNHHDRHCHGR